MIPPNFNFLKKSLDVKGWENNRKTLIVPRQKVDQLLYAVLSNVDVDSAWYCDRYPDVARAIQSGEFKNAKIHYMTNGYFEGRVPSLKNFDPKGYLQKNKDIAAELNGRDPVAYAEEHYTTFGYAEGRYY